MKTMCGYYIGMDCNQQRTDTFAVRKGQEEVSYSMYRTTLCIGQYPFEVRGKVWEFVEYPRSDLAFDEEFDEEFDQEFDQFTLNAEEEDVRRCYGLELGVMLEVARNFLHSISDRIDGRE
jgi:hypothetical protein